MGRITWRSAAVTRFMSLVPESTYLQRSVTEVLRFESIVSLVIGGFLG